MGGFQSQSMMIKSSTEQLTDSIIKQDLTLGKVANRGWKNFSKEIDRVTEQQMRLRQSIAVGWRTGPTGTLSADLIIPNEALSRMDQARIRMGMLVAAAESVSNNMIKFGKNMQWAGRQLMVGITLPLILMGGAATKSAVQVDAELVRLQKVYGDTADVSEMELARVREATVQTAKSIASAYGIAVEETVSLGADLAQAGYAGVRLQETLAAVSRISLLGELDRQTALNGTISIQSIWNKSTAELSDTFNRLNVVENQTTVNTKELMDAIPRAGGVVNELGGSVEFLAAMLAGMKERGVVDVDRAATAIRTSLLRVMNPTKKAIDGFKGILDIQNLYRNSGNDLQLTLERLAVEFGNMGQQQAAALSASLFGVHRANEMLLLFDSMRDKSSSYARALEVVGMSSAEVANIAANEVERFTESASGKFKRLVATLKAEIAEFGGPLIEIANTMLGFVVKIIDALNRIPSGARGLLLFVAGLALAVGPLVMLGGLITNLIGQIARFGVGIIGLFNKFRPLTAEQVAHNAEAIKMVQNTRSQTSAFAALAMELQQVNKQFAQMAVDARIAAAATQKLPPLRDERGRFISQGPRKRALAAAEEAAYMENEIRNQIGQRGVSQANESAAAAAARKQGLRTAISSVAMLSTGFMLLSGNTSKWVTTVATGLFVLSSIVPIMKSLQLLEKSRALWTGITTGAMQLYTATSTAGLVGLTAQARAFGVSLWAATGPLAILAAGIAAAAVGGVMLAKSIRESKKNAEQLATAGRTLGESVGYTWREAGQTVDETGQKVAGLSERAAGWSKNNKAVVDDLKSVAENTELVTLRAVGYGVQLRENGATAQQALEATRVALMAAGRLDLAENISIDFDNAMSVAEAKAADLADRVNRVINNSFRQTWGESFSRWLFGESGFNEAAKRQAESLGKDLAHTFASATHEDTRRAFEGLIDTFDAQMSSAVQALSRMTSKDKETFVKLGIDPNDQQAIIDFFVSLDASIKHTGMFSDEVMKLGGEINKVGAASRKVAEDFLRTAHMENMGIDTTRGLVGVYAQLRSRLITVEEASAAYEEKVRLASRALGGLSDEQRLNMLNQERLAAGLEKVTDLSIGFGDAIDRLKNSTRELTDEEAKMMEAVDEIASSMQSSISESMGQAAEFGIQAFNDQTDAYLRFLQRQDDANDKSAAKRAKVADDTRDKIVDAIDDERDKRIKALKDAQKADDRRERSREEMFRRERIRLERMAQIANLSIDFNSALALGNLDEAAKIMEQQNANEQTWNLEDAREAEKKAYEDRKQRRSDEIDQINEVANARIDAANKAYEKEKELLEKEKDLNKERRRDAEETYRRMRESQRRRLEAELDMLKRSVPSSQAEYDKMLDGLAKLFGSYGVTLNRKSAEWNSMVSNGWRTAMQRVVADMKNKVNWEDFGTTISQKITSGMFTNLDFEQFVHWMLTGQLPPNVTPKVAGAGEPPDMNRKGVPVRHAGGMANGYGANTTRKNLKGDEVPAILQTGEFVVNRDTVSRLGADYFEFLQSQKFHNGGVVNGVGGVVGGMVAAALKAAMIQGINRKNAEVSVEDRMPTDNLSLVNMAAASGLMAPDGWAPWVPDIGRTGVDPSVVARMGRVLSQLPGGQMIVSGYRPGAIIKGTNKPSLHSIGKALDVGMNAYDPVQSRIGDRLAQILRSGVVPGVREVLWKTMTGGNHFDHLHAGFYHNGGLAKSIQIPALGRGASINYDNTIANLHKGERVLTAPLTQKLDKGIDRLTGAGDTYYVELIAGPNASAKDMLREFQALKKKSDAQQGHTKRVVG